MCSLHCYAILYVLSCFAVILVGKRELLTLLITCDCYFSVAFPHGAVCLSALHDCGISWSDSLIISVLSCNGLYIFKSFLFEDIRIESSG